MLKSTLTASRSKASAAASRKRAAKASIAANAATANSIAGCRCPKASTPRTRTRLSTMASSKSRWKRRSRRLQKRASWISAKSPNRRQSGKQPNLRALRADNLKGVISMLCSEIMTRNPEYCLPSDPVVKAARLMKSEDVGPIPIVDDKDGRRLAGIVTDRDLAIKVVAEARDPQTTPLKQVMTSDIVTCKEDDDVEK